MLRTGLLAILALTTPVLAQGPGIAWAVSHNGSASPQDEPIELALSAGGLFVAGRSYHFETRDDITLLRYGTDGVLRWSARYDNPAHLYDQPSDLEPDGAGGAFVAGYSIQGGNSWETLILHYDSDGTLDWEEHVPTTGYLYRDWGVHLAAAADGSFRLGYTTANSFAVRAYGPDRGLLWAREIDVVPGQEDVLTDVALDAAGNTVFAGAPDFGRGGFETGMLDPEGNLLWTDNEFGPQGAQFGPAQVRIDGNRDIVSCFTTESTCGVSQTRVIRSSPDGVRQWSRYFAPDPCDSAEAVDVELDADGNTLVLCQVLVRGSPTSYDAVVLKYDTQGNLLWVYPLEAQYTDLPTSLAVDRAGNCYIADSNASGGNTYDTLLASLTPGGSLRWQLFYDAGETNDRPADIAVSPKGEAYFTEMANIPGNNGDILTVKLRPFPLVTMPRP